MELTAIYPNPFNSTMTIKFSLPSQGKVVLRVFDLTGREIALLENGNIEAGNHSVVWDARNFTSGIYICHLEANGITKSRKLILTK
jgi:hypothetical protein